MPTSNATKGAKIYQVFYDEHSRKELDSQFIAFNNQHCNRYFESQVIADLYDRGEMTNCDYFGVVSWRIWQKVNKVSSLETFILQDKKAHDFYFSNWWWGTSKSVWQQTEDWIGSDLTSWPEKLINELGYKSSLKSLKTYPAFYNYQICRTELYKEYVEKFMKPIMGIMEDKNRADLQAWLYEPVNYKRSPPVTGMTGQMLKALLRPFSQTQRDRILKALTATLGRFQAVNQNLISQQYLETIIGRPHYTRHSFVMEALFPTYAALRGWSGKPFSS